MSDIETTTGLPTEEGCAGRTEKAKAALGQAGQAIKQEAQSFANVAQERARAEAQKHTDTATRTLGDFANAVRKAGDELGAADQTPAARLVRQAADGLESLSRNLSGKQPEDLLNDVRSFARSHPAAFIGGAVLVGVALGRFVRASETGAATSLGEFAGGATAYPEADTQPVMVGGEATGDEALALAEEDGFDGPAELSGAQASGIESSVQDDLGDLKPSTGPER
jgi:hypothetical protein